MTDNLTVAFKTNAEQKERLRQYAKKTKRSMSGVVKYALDQLLEKGDPSE